MTTIIGENETPDKCTQVKYKWAEIKSSLLMKELNHNKTVNKMLTDYLQGILTRLFNILNINLDKEIERYLRLLETSIQKDIVQSYPVSQSKAWLKNPEGLWKNFYALVNFSKWVWINLKTGAYYDITKCQKNPMFYYIIIQMFQQQFIAFHGILRGGRINLSGGIPNDKIGISDFDIQELQRVVYNNNEFKVEPWLHPGNSQCRVTYRGKYGSLIKKYRQDNNFYGSLKCGISGSVQYMFFMYLFSIAGGGGNPKEDVRNMILTACLILIGDGGHNLREVVFGIVCSTIIANTFLIKLNEELTLIFNGRTIQENNDKVQNADKGQIYKGPTLQLIYNFITQITKTIICKTNMTKPDIVYKEIFKAIIHFSTSIEPFIKTLYTFTNKINIVGVYENDIYKYDERFRNQSFMKKAKDEIKQSELEVMFKTDKGKDFANIPNNINNAQLFFALDNDRYLQPENTFKTSANELIIYCINSIDPNILSNVNKKLTGIIEKCEINPINTEAKDIPFA